MIGAAVRRILRFLSGPPLRLLGLQLSPIETPAWDAQFQEWVRIGEATGRDPNDVGDEEWLGTALEEVRRHYLPHITKDAVVLELGPGTGRHTRHVIGECARMILVDYSPWVCRWLTQYLDGKGDFEVHHVVSAELPGVPDGVVDFAFATGVFEHLAMDRALWFLDELFRVLRPGGRIAFNFDDVMKDAGLAHLRKFQLSPEVPHVFCYYHPDTMTRLVAAAGFIDAEVTHDETRLCFLGASKPK